MLSDEVIARLKKANLHPMVPRFNKGDLMYGISPTRDIYLLWLESYHINNVVPEPGDNTWARQNGFRGRSSRSMIINCYSDVLRTNLSNEIERLKKKPSASLSRDSLVDALKQSNRATGRGQYGHDFRGYGDIALDHEKLKITSKHVDNNLWWKRGSKSGIEMVASQPVGSARRLHFVLDGMDILGVATKNKELKGQSITSSELRYIYRHWNRLERRVLFYKEGRVVQAPWVDPATREHWANYTPGNTRAENII